MKFNNRTTIRHLRRRGRRRTSCGRDVFAIGFKLIAGVALLTVVSPGDLYAQDSGIRLGTFLLRPSFSVDLGYDSNAANSSDEEAGTLTNLMGGVGVETDWSRHSLTGSINTSLGGDTAAAGCDCDFGLNVGTRLDAIGDPNSPKSLSFGIAAGTAISAGSSSRNGVVLGERSQEYTSSFGASVQGRANRFYGSASGEYLVYRYEDAVFDASRPNPNSSSTFVDSHRNRTRAKAGLSGGYEISPNLRVVGNFGYDQVRHDSTNVGRIDFNLTTGTAGVQLSVPDSNISGTLEVGAKHVCGDGGGTENLDHTSFAGTGSLDWEVRRTVRLGAVLSTNFHSSETETANNLGTEEVRLALTANTDLSRDIGLDVMISGTFLDHLIRNSAGGTSVDRSDTQYSFSTVSTYRFARNYGVKGTLTYSGLTSSDNNANYQSLYVGVGISGSY